MITEHLSETAKHGIDLASVGWLVAIFVANLPTITAVLVLLWTAMRIYECWLTIREKRAALAERRDAP